MKFVLEIAGVAVEVNHQFSYIRNLCEDYIVGDDTKTAFSVHVTEEEMEEEMCMTEQRFPREICESTCIHRAVVVGLVKYGIILMHSAVIAVDGKAYVFMAKSGVGKSTHIRLWKAHFGDRAVVVNGDKPMFAFAKDQDEKECFMVYGSPWRGKELWGQNMSMPVAGICLLERGEVNSIERASQADIIGKLFHQVLLPKTQPDLSTFMQMLDRLVKEVPFYKLKCNMEKDAAIVSYEGMKN